jgi:uncharacterized protein YdhG (YjbR/CyaY superfamily)
MNINEEAINTIELLAMELKSCNKEAYRNLKQIIKWNIKMLKSQDKQLKKIEKTLEIINDSGKVW